MRKLHKTSAHQRAAVMNVSQSTIVAWDTKPPTKYTRYKRPAWYDPDKSLKELEYSKCAEFYMYGIQTSASPDHIAEHSDLLEHAMAAFNQLPERERFILTARFGLAGEEPRSLYYIGKLINKTAERVRQIILRALGDMRQQL